MMQWIKEYESGKTLEELAFRNQCSVTKIRNYLLKQGVVLRVQGQQHVLPEKKSFEDDCKKLRWYQLEKKYNVSWSIIKSWKRKYGIVDGKKHDREIIWKITAKGCWKCSSHRLHKGYLRVKGDLVARKLWSDKFGEWPKGQVMRHLCANKWCVNPYHIVPGDQKYNIIDTMLSGKVVVTEDVCRSMIKNAVVDGILLSQNNKLIRLEDGKSFDMPYFMIGGGGANDAKDDL
jgi:hypothetical protein